ncbi:hypothetical protein F2Q69_00001622 [Brassica cretica]|uniref:Uncharacterized protein n=1 Tax=Brassica cretica TaxID=69181 RepID=A0A8S9PPT3_BRACR|nr:hypothetical protein F2Q69_00001622 [Brassica cretica]
MAIHWFSHSTGRSLSTGLRGFSPDDDSTGCSLSTGRYLLTGHLSRRRFIGLLTRRGVLSRRGFAASLSTAIRRGVLSRRSFSLYGPFSLDGASLSAAIHLPFSLDGVFVYFDHRTIVSSKAIADSK